MKLGGATAAMLRNNAVWIEEDLQPPFEGKLQGARADICRIQLPSISR